MKKLLFASVLGLLFATACIKQDDTTADAKNYYQAYEVEYNAAENKTITRAFFRKNDENGEFLELTNGAEVRVNGETLSRDSDNSATYYATFNGHVDTNYYEYADKDGNIYTNEFYLSEVEPIDFLSNPGPFNMFSNYKVSWDGPPVGENETVIFQIGYEDGKVKTITVNKEGTDYVDLDDKILMEVGPGEARMKIFRLIEQSLKDTNEAGGRVQLIYSTGLVPVTIED